MSPYLQHARRHLPGGTDPLEITQGLPYLAGSKIGISIPSVVAGNPGTTVTLDELNWETSDSDIFGIDASNFIQIKQAGLYLAVCSAHLGTSSTPAAGAFAACDLNLGFLGLVANSQCPFTGYTGNYEADPGGASIINEHAGDVPASAPIVITQTSGVTISAQVELMIVQVNPTPVSLFI